MQEQLIKVFNYRDRLIKIKVASSPPLTVNSGKAVLCKTFWPGNWDAQKI